MQVGRGVKGATATAVGRQGVALAALLSDRSVVDGL